MTTTSNLPDVRNNTSGFHFSSPLAYRESIIDDMVESWKSFLRGHLRVELGYSELPELLGYLIGPLRKDGSRKLVISSSLSNSSTIYLLILSASHIILGHLDDAFCTIVMPKKEGNRYLVELSSKEAQELDAAIELARKLFWEVGIDLFAEYDRELSGVPLDFLGRVSDRSWKMRLYRKLLTSGITRKAILAGLQIVQEMYYNHEMIQSLLGSRGHEEIRELYYLTKVSVDIPAFTELHK